jgi:glutamate racemase
MNNKAIGIFDSGIGGLTVYKEISEILPSEKIIYLGDTARLPYGNKSAPTIRKFSYENVSFLLKHDVKMVVVACNTSSSYALTYLQERFPLPIVGVIEPGAEAAFQSGAKRIGVIGTSATIKSEAYPRAIRERDHGVEVFSKDCPLLVPLIEEGWLDHQVTELVLREYLEPLTAEKIETLVLGCTHYPILKQRIAKIVTPAVTLVDSAETTAHKVATILKELNWLNEDSGRHDDLFFVSDFPERFQKVGEIFLQRDIRNVNLTEIEEVLC